MNTSNYLPIDGTATLKSAESVYRIDKVLGAGGFGITYSATGSIRVHNITTAARFAIKEYFPVDYCRREGRKVIADIGHENDFLSGMNDFIHEAQRLHDIGVGSANIVKVNEVFEANGTAYYIMEHIDGRPLTTLITGQDGRRLRYEEALSLLEPIMDAVDYLHRNNITHLDIKPDNMMIRTDYEGNPAPVLIDFGQSLHFKKNGNVTSPKGVTGVSEGYSPMEQYAGIKRFAPEADIYALTATLYFVLTGRAPEAAAELNEEKISRALSTIVPREYMDAFLKGMAKLSEERVSSISVLKGLLGMTGGHVDIGGRGHKTDPIGKKTLFDKVKDVATDWGKPAVGVIIGAAIVGIVIIVMNGVHKCEGSASTTDTVLTSKDSLRIDSISNAPEDSDANKPPLPPTPTTNTTQQTQSTQQSSTPIVSSQTSNTSSGGASSSSASNVTTTSRINLGYAVWQGQVSGGKPNGKGTMTFTQAHSVPTAGGYDIQADAGDYVSGYATNGKIEQGVLYDSAGNKKASIIY